MNKTGMILTFILLFLIEISALILTLVQGVGYEPFMMTTTAVIGFISALFIKPPAT